MANQNAPAGETWRTIADTAEHFGVKPRQVYRWLEQTEDTSAIRRKIDEDGRRMVHIPTATTFVNNLPRPGRPRKTP